MFRQVGVDGGKEFYLSLFTQEEHEHLRGNASHIAPYSRTQSKRVSMYRHVYTDADAYTV